MAVRRYRSKYGASKVTIEGITFDSKREAQRYLVLRDKEKAGEISNLQRQVKYVLIPEQREESTEVYKKGPKKGQLKPGTLLERECSYFADFVYTENETQIVEDAKGMRTPEYIIKRKLMLFIHDIKIREV